MAEWSIVTGLFLQFIGLVVLLPGLLPLVLGGREFLQKLGPVRRASKTIWSELPKPLYSLYIQREEQLTNHMVQRVAGSALGNFLLMLTNLVGVFLFAPPLAGAIAGVVGWPHGTASLVLWAWLGVWSLAFSFGRFVDVRHRWRLNERRRLGFTRRRLFAVSLVHGVYCSVVLPPVFLLLALHAAGVALFLGQARLLRIQTVGRKARERYLVAASAFYLLLATSVQIAGAVAIALSG